MKSGKLNHQQLKELIIASFEAEKNCDVEAGLQLLHPDFEVIEMSLKSDGVFFRRITSEKAKDLIREVYKISTRNFVYKNILTDVDKQVVAVEFLKAIKIPKQISVFAPRKSL